MYGCHSESTLLGHRRNGRHDLHEFVTFCKKSVANTSGKKCAMRTGCRERSFGLQRAHSTNSNANFAKLIWGNKFDVAKNPIL